MDLDVDHIASRARAADEAAARAIADLLTGATPPGRPPIAPGGGGGDNGGMNERIARLEAIAESTDRRLTTIEGDLRAFAGETRTEFGKVREEFGKVRSEMKVDFRLTWTGLILGFLGIAGLMAKGFGWF